MTTSKPIRSPKNKTKPTTTSGLTEPLLEPRPPRTAKSRFLKHQDQATTTTLRHPPYLYIRLHLLSPSSHATTATIPTLDALTLHTYLRSALTSYHGLHGSAIADSIDILQISAATNTGLVRVAYQDGTAVTAGIAAWAGSSGGERLGIDGSGVWLGGLLGPGAGGRRDWGGSGDGNRGALWSLES